MEEGVKYMLGAFVVKGGEDGLFYFIFSEALGGWIGEVKNYP